MNRTESVSKSDPTAARFVPNELAEEIAETDVADAYAAEAVVADSYDRLNLAPTTLESLVTWDVSVHARRDQERLRQVAARIPDAAPSVD